MIPIGWDFFSIKAWKNVKAYQHILRYSRDWQNEKHALFITDMIKAGSCTVENFKNDHIMKRFWNKLEK